MDEWLESFARTVFKRSADTAHDLKTPLNVAVLSLELLRMRLAKLSQSLADDDKVAAYIGAVDIELRRLARIFDAFFVLSTPPRGDEARTDLDLAALAREAAATAGYELSGNGSATLRAHESRIRQGLKMLFEGTSKILQQAGRTATMRGDDERFAVIVTGLPEGNDFELSKIFKFYYTDPQGVPDLSLAAARLIAETYGGELNAAEEHDKVVLRLSFPLR